MRKDFLGNPQFLSQIEQLSNSTPFFVFNKKALIEAYEEFRNTLPVNTEICYSMKANSEKIVLKTLFESGCNFEVASKYELDFLKVLKIPANKLIYGSSVKIPSHIPEFFKYGVDRMAFDSEEELYKIAQFAPGARVYLRVLVDDRADSLFHMSKKFGVALTDVARLLVKAKELGLVPYGISFNVGSQARSDRAWERGIEDVSKAMNNLLKKGIKIQMINIGGGFPYVYKSEPKAPEIETISKHIKKAMSRLPYPVNLIVEPGRGLIASSFVLVASVTAKIKKNNKHWLHLDAGSYNALLETLESQGTIRYKVELLLKSSSSTQHYILTGPACDDLDILDKDAILSEDVEIGDKLLFYNTGAYSFTLMTRFNGFPKPEVVIL